MRRFLTALFAFLGVLLGGRAKATSSTTDTLVEPHNLGDILCGVKEDELSTANTKALHGVTNIFVNFAVGWSGGDIFVTGSRGGATVTETFPSPGPSGGDFEGIKGFDVVTNVSNTATGGTGANVATVSTGASFGVAHYPVTSFDAIKVGYVGQPLAASSWVSVDLTYGMIRPTEDKAGEGSGQAYEVTYTY